MVNMLSSQQKQLLRECKKEDQIPKSEQMIKVSSMMGPADHSMFKNGNLASIFVEVPEHGIFSVRHEQMVPKTSVIQRDQSGQLVGISAVSGG